MITFTLTKFKCMKNLVLKIPVGSVTLLKAFSGAGKTSILKSIEWVMYGVSKKITPHHTPTSKTNVTFETPQFLISRTKHPNSLSFTFKNETYKDADAQRQINQLYGSYEVWMSSVYMAQMSHNHFLTANNAGKMDLLNQFSFHNENPTEYVDKIEKELLKQKSILQVKAETLQTRMTDFEQYDVNKIKNKLDTDIVQQKTDELNTLHTHLDQLIKQKQAYDVNVALRAQKDR